MKIHKNTLNLLLLILLIQGCKSVKPTSIDQSKIESEIDCLILFPPAYHCVRFNPVWVVENNIESIVEREYLDGKDGKIHLVSILEYRSDGYLDVKYSGLGYPKDDTPNKENIFSKWEYKTQKLDSFVIHTSKIVRFHNGNGKMEKPDTLQMGGNIFNIKNALAFVNGANELVKTYEYDNLNRLISEKDGKGESEFTIVYHDYDKIEIVKFSRYHNKEYSSWVKLDNQKRIIQNFDESNNLTHEFKYDSLGRMIEDKHWFKGKEPNYHTYEYKIKNSR